jgi:hypothetical protein
MKRRGLLAITIVLLVLAYVPIISGLPKVWSLFLYWTLLALFELLAVSVRGWGGDKA